MKISVACVISSPNRSSVNASDLFDLPEVCAGLPPASLPLPATLFHTVCVLNKLLPECVCVWVSVGHTNHFQFVQFLCQLESFFLLFPAFPPLPLLCHFCLAGSNQHTSLNTLTHTHSRAHTLLQCTLATLLLGCTSAFRLRRH